MSTTAHDEIKYKDSKDSGEDQETLGTLNSPDLDKTGKPQKRAITEAKQAHQIAKNLRQKALDGRIKVAAVIAGKYNGELPFNEAKLREQQQGWRNNFSTQFLASIVDRVKPQFQNPINQAGVITYSSLPSLVPEAATKSRKFQEITTKTIRAWIGWNDFISGLIDLDLLFGNAAPARLDSETDWRPRNWRFDECYFPEGTGQHSSKLPVGAFEQEMVLHEFIKLIRNPEAAKRAGFDVENCIKEANKAKAGSNKDESDLAKQDAIREGSSIADTYATETRTVKLFHVVVQDYTGEVDLWTVTQEDGTLIRNVQRHRGKMEDAITFFTMQSGNHKYYGSKGLGRLLVNLHTAIERGRCLGADQMYLAGMVIMQADPKDINTIGFRVLHPFMVVPKDNEISQVVVKFDAMQFEVMDKKWTGIAESIAGAFIPPNIDNQGSSNTKIEAAQKAEREMAVKAGVLGRFWTHLSDLVSMMQRSMYCAVNLKEGKRIYDERQKKKEKGIKLFMRKIWDVIKVAIPEELRKNMGAEPEIVAADEEAVQAVVELLEEGLSIEEIAILAHTPSANSSQDQGLTRDQSLLAYIEESRNNPYVDQRVAEEMKAAIRLGEDVSRQLLIPMEDPNVEAQAYRQQIIEVSEMMDGEWMPVVSSDNHKLHRGTLAKKLVPIMQLVEQGATPPLVKAAELMLAHYMEHLKVDMKTDDETKKKEAGLIQQFTKILQDAAARMQDPNDPINVEGKPLQAGGPNGEITGTEQPGPEQLEATRKGAETSGKLLLALKDQELRQQELDFEKEKHEHQKTTDAMKLQQSNLTMIKDLAVETQEKGIVEGQQDIEQTV